MVKTNMVHFWDIRTCVLDIFSLAVESAHHPVTL